MAINFTLVDAFDVQDDPMGREWVGWDPYVTDDHLWAVNRGVWRLGPRAAKERFATLSYRGRVQVVAEITGQEQYDDYGTWKTALAGIVLHPGDPVRDELVGTLVPTQRNPVSYLPTDQFDTITPSERSIRSPRTSETFLLTWNPSHGHWHEDEFGADLDAIEHGGFARGQWSMGNRTTGVEPGDRFFLLVQGAGPRGVIASGVLSSRVFQGPHFDQTKGSGQANYALVEFDALLQPHDALSRERLIDKIPSGGPWLPQGSGTRLDPTVAKQLEILWAAHLGLDEPMPPRGRRGQQWQLDPDRRKKVEDAAQRRLEKLYDEAGWSVNDVRHQGPYDAIAIKNGRTLYLEAKGTETPGASVIVTRNEVDFARAHPGQCIIGVLSNVRFDPAGNIDDDSGDFVTYPWSPADQELAVRAYDWTPSTDPSLDLRLKADPMK